MTSLDSSIRSCTHRIIPAWLAGTAIAFITVIIVYSFQGEPLHKNAAIGFTATFGAFIALVCLGKVYIHFKGPPKPLPDEERPSSTSSNLHPTMAPMQRREESQASHSPTEPRQSVDGPPAHDRSPPDDRAAIPRPLNVPPRPLNLPARGQGNGNYYLDRSLATLNTVPPTHRTEEPRRQNVDANGSPILEGPHLMAPPFVGSGYGQLARSAPGVHTGPLHVVNLVTMPANTDFQQLCAKHNIPHDLPKSPKPHPRTPKFGKTKRRDKKFWATHGSVKKQHVKIRSSTLASPTTSMKITIDDNIESEHSDSTTAIESSPSSGPPSSKDTVFSMEISKA